MVTNLGKGVELSLSSKACKSPYELPSSAKAGNSWINSGKRKPDQEAMAEEKQSDSEERSNRAGMHGTKAGEKGEDESDENEENEE